MAVTKGSALPSTKQDVPLLLPEVLTGDIYFSPCLGHIANSAHYNMLNKDEIHFVTQSFVYAVLPPWMCCYLHISKPN